MNRPTGDDVFRSLMDLDLIFHDADKMIALKLFLASVDPVQASSSLEKLHDEILAFTARIELLVTAASPRG